MKKIRLFSFIPAFFIIFALAGCGDKNILKSETPPQGVSISEYVSAAVQAAEEITQDEVDAAEAARRKLPLKKTALLDKGVRKVMDFYNEVSQHRHRGGLLEDARDFLDDEKKLPLVFQDKDDMEMCTSHMRIATAVYAGMSHEDVKRIALSQGYFLPESLRREVFP